MEKGLVKMQNFSQSKSKLRYAYLLTPAGLAAKSKLTAEFLSRKVAEYESLQVEINVLTNELHLDGCSIGGQQNSRIYCSKAS